MVLEIDMAGGGGSETKTTYIIASYLHCCSITLIKKFQKNSFAFLNYITLSNYRLLPTLKVSIHMHSFVTSVKGHVIT